MAYLHNSDIKIAENQSHLLTSCTEQYPESFLNSKEYSRYVLSCLTSVYQNNLFLYRLPQTLILYSGGDNYKSDKMWLYLNAEAASKHGNVYEYNLSHELLLVALDRVSNLQIIKATALSEDRHDVVAALDNSFKVTELPDGKTIILRSADLDDNLTISSYLCELGYQGFACKPLTEPNDRLTLHDAEVFVCNSHNCLSDRRLSELSGQFVQPIN